MGRQTGTALCLMDDLHGLRRSGGHTHTHTSRLNSTHAGTRYRSDSGSLLNLLLGMGTRPRIICRGGAGATGGPLPFKPSRINYSTHTLSLLSDGLHQGKITLSYTDTQV